MLHYSYVSLKGIQKPNLGVCEHKMPLYCVILKGTFHRHIEVNLVLTLNRMFHYKSYICLNCFT